MDLDDRKRLRKKKTYCDLVENVIFYEIQDDLYGKKILEIDEVKEIQSLGSKGYGPPIRRLIAILEKKSTPGLISSFCEVLEDRGYEWIARAIEDTDTSEVPDEDVVDSAKSRKDEKQMMLVRQIVAETQKRLVEQMSAETRKMMVEQMAETQKISSRMSNVELKLEQSLYPKNHASKEPLKLPHAVEGWDVVDAPTSKRFVNKCIEEFIRKPRKRFSMIEEVACRLGLEVTLIFSDVSLNEDICTSDDAMLECVTTMRQVVKRMTAEHADIIKECLDDLDMLEMNGYRTVDLIADVLFQDDMDVNWGRIICWFTFWGQFVKYLHVSKVEKPEAFVKFYGEFIGFYLAKRLHLWIAGAGGWVSSRHLLSTHARSIQSTVLRR